MESFDPQREVFSRKLRAGRRTYLFDVRATRGSDYYLTITERKRLPDGVSHHKQKIFLYKEDFVNFIHALEDTIEYVRQELLPDYDFDQHARRTDSDAESDYHPGEDSDRE